MNAIFYRLPHASTLFMQQPSDEIGVQFYDFDGKAQYHFYGEPTEISAKVLRNLDLEIYLLDRLSEEEGITAQEYEQKIQEVIAFIKEHQLAKLVISREKKIFFHHKTISLTHTFLELCQAFPQALVYLFIQDGVCWIGATPEILGQYNIEQQRFQTMSLAGTLPLNEAWSDKEIEEQQAVTDYIKNQLAPFSSDIQVSETYSMKSGSIKHLRNDFELSVPPQQVEELIKTLHPTPAVCGMPKDFCKQSILNFETHQRQLYTGYIKIQHHGSIYAFVNLRCAQVFQNGLIAYVGGGITAKSLPAKEWEETELKSMAIGSHLFFSLSRIF